MRIDFVDKLMRFNPYPKLFIDKQPITRRVLISSKKIKRYKISSCVLKSNILSRTREDEKKDERVDDSEFMRIGFATIENFPA